MITAVVRRGIAACRDPGRAPRIAQALWIAWAIVAWNVIFDHVIVVAGREYLAAAVLAAHGAGSYARMDDWMRPAITRGAWTATAASAVILLVGLASVRLASTNARATPTQAPAGDGRLHPAEAPSQGGHAGEMTP